MWRDGLKWWGFLSLTLVVVDAVIFQLYLYIYTHTLRLSNIGWQHLINEAMQIELVEWVRMSGSISYSHSQILNRAFTLL